MSLNIAIRKIAGDKIFLDKTMISYYILKGKIIFKKDKMWTQSLWNLLLKLKDHCLCIGLFQV